jgi:two-component system chemotaxis response regulator CheY
MKKIMIIDDDRDLQEIYKINFEMAGYEVLQEMDGLDGISSVVDKQPDIILLDINMPNMDGFAFLKAMKDNTSINIPVVVCSNLSDKETYAKAISTGALAVLLKVDHSGKQLVEKIGHLLNGVNI